MGRLVRTGLAATLALGISGIGGGVAQAKIHHKARKAAVAVGAYAVYHHYHKKHQREREQAARNQNVR